MHTATILLHDRDELKRVISAAGKYSYRVQFVSSSGGRTEANSLLGLFRLDLNEPILVECATGDAGPFFAEIREFIVE